MDDNELKELYDEYYSNKVKLRDMLRDKEIVYPHKQVEFKKLKTRNKNVESVLNEYNLI